MIRTKAYPPSQPPPQTDFQCNWIFYHHILEIRAYQSRKYPEVKSIITFKNGQLLPIDVSHFVWEKQMERTATCLFEHKIS
ncbi:MULTISPECIES: competence protein ComK [Bacillaceae]|uniref:competence protein ComK n=1 Tax=Bacillaceae TaxID=186817 RepID=UPI00135629E5